VRVRTSRSPRPASASPPRCTRMSERHGAHTGTSRPAVDATSYAGASLGGPYSGSSTMEQCCAHKQR
jgi:hypothetical protein